MSNKQITLLRNLLNNLYDFNDVIEEFSDTLSSPQKKKAPTVDTQEQWKFRLPFEPTESTQSLKPQGVEKEIRKTKHDLPILDLEKIKQERQAP
mmetsp:Transcript_16057/g.24927  ORF Transcript_16057/g.24927 Transcript_16057/m.24927 type:complete len:94 (+) Transcript_16057:450-731(+)